MEWYRNLRIVLSVEDKLPFLGHPKPAISVPTAGQVLPPDVLNTHIAWVKASKEITSLMLMTRGVNWEEGQSVSSYVLKMKSYIDNLEHLGHVMTQNLYKKPHKAAKGNQGKGKAKMGYTPVQAPPFAPKPKNPPIPKKDNSSKDAICHQYGEVDGKKTYSHQVERATDLLRLIHTDVCGPFKIMSRQVAYYFITFTDDFSRYGYVYLLKHKHEVFETFKVFQKEVEKQLEKSIKSQRFDRGCEYTSQDFLDHLKERGIIAHRTPPYPPQHNGMSERRNRTLLDMVRSMMSQTILPKSFWDYDLEFTACILNMVPTKKALVKRDTLTKPDKLEPRSIKCIFVGYLKEMMGYSFYYPPENKVFVAWNAEFLENSLIAQEANNKVWELVDLPPDGKTVGHKWLFKKKTNMDGAAHTYKARLVAKGFTQTIWINYKETFSPVAEIRVIRIFIAIAAFYDYEIWQIDVKTTFLNGYLNEENITSRFQHNHCEVHWTAVENILKYLRNTKDMFLVYGGDTKRDFKVSFYTDAGYLTDADDMKPQAGYGFVLNRGAVD
uniref:Integrase catalytic domain-containing protein n=1 Tax=Tanacetum cinerariifolium TaxID=118510 RepID=A0A699HDN9_TANCI|nr:hypothetical protein [Tanacetum cinerariifolium]